MHTGLQIIEAHRFKVQFGIVFGPIDLRSLTADNARSTSSGLMMYSSGMTRVGISVNAKAGKSFVT